MTLTNNYPSLSQFLTSYFPDADLEGLTDKEVVKNFLNTNPDEEVRYVKKQMQQLLDSLVFWEEIGLLANRYFETQQEAFTWLKMIYLEIES